jgi:hypothetical protein
MSLSFFAWRFASSAKNKHLDSKGSETCVCSRRSIRMLIKVQVLWLEGHKWHGLRREYVILSLWCFRIVCDMLFSLYLQYKSNPYFKFLFLDSLKQYRARWITYASHSLFAGSQALVNLNISYYCKEGLRAPKNISVN